jgi:hypothetical protein
MMMASAPKLLVIPYVVSGLLYCNKDYVMHYTACHLRVCSDFLSYFRSVPTAWLSSGSVLIRYLKFSNSPQTQQMSLLVTKFIIDFSLLCA